MGFSRQEYWSGLPFPSPGDLPDPGIKPRSPTLEADALTSEPPGKQYGRPRFNPWVWKIPKRRERLPTPVFWPGKFHGLYSPWGGKESDTTEQPSLLLSMVSPTVWWAACPKPQLQRGAEPGFKVGWPETTSSVPATSPPSSKLILSREPLVLPLGSSDRATGPQSPVTYEQVTTELVEAKFLHVDMNAWKEWE